MHSDFSYIITWWLFFFLFGIIFLPITSIIFKPFFDKGYIFSKIIGVAVVSYIVFLLGTLHITPFTQLTITIVFLLCFIGNIFIVYKKYANKLIFRLSRIVPLSLLLVFFFEEGMFFLAL